ncbi:MAG: DUF192 domain-containing protein [Pseudomonadota bacterium]
MGKRDQGRRLTFWAALFVAVPGIVFAQCRDGAVQVKGDWGQAQFTIDLADEPEERSRGLMHVESMAQNAGMLFVYEEPQVARFWMKNTLISLDMIFADATGTVQKVHREAVPLSERLINGGRDIQYVLEVNGGVAARFGIGPGDQLRHPAIEQGAAAWPCD